MSSEKHLITEETPEVRDLFTTIERLQVRAIGFSGVLVRSVGSKYAKQTDFFSGKGAAKTGGRWNRVGLEAVYASLDVMTATKEAYQNFIVYKLPLSSIRPRVMAGADVVLNKILDITNPSIRRVLGFSLEELVNEDWRGIQTGGDESWTQAIGRGCVRSGFEGILVPSARNARGKNMVLFPQNFTAACKLQIIAANDLQ
ncbi:MAG: RES domain-containing protein [Planctomycetaceae bacterium]|nr:RES domain-containing protein [Planctomycetaceae bacterium]